MLPVLYSITGNRKQGAFFKMFLLQCIYDFVPVQTGSNLGRRHDREHITRNPGTEI